MYMYMYMYMCICIGICFYICSYSPPPPCRLEVGGLVLVVVDIITGVLYVNDFHLTFYVIATGVVIMSAMSIAMPQHRR